MSKLTPGINFADTRSLLYHLGVQGVNFVMENDIDLYLVYVGALIIH